MRRLIWVVCSRCVTRMISIYILHLLREAQSLCVTWSDVMFKRTKNIKHNNTWNNTNNVELHRFTQLEPKYQTRKALPFVSHVNSESPELSRVLKIFNIFQNAAGLCRHKKKICILNSSVHKQGQKRNNLPTSSHRRLYQQIMPYGGSSNLGKLYTENKK